MNLLMRCLASKRAQEVLSRVALFAVDDPILATAATLKPVDLRSLNAIHLATALALSPDADGIVSYDRLNAAAATFGLQVLAPRHEPVSEL